MPRVGLMQFPSYTNHVASRSLLTAILVLLGFGLLSARPKLAYLSVRDS
jgi:hypothetical protein